MKVDDISFTARTLTVFKALNIETVEDAIVFPWEMVHNKTIGESQFHSGVRVNDKVIRDIEDNISRIIISN